LNKKENKIIILKHEYEDELGRDEISDDDDYDQDDLDESEYLERNAKRSEVEDDDDEDDDDEEEGTYDEDSSDEEVATIRLHKPSLKEKIGFLLLGAAASALGGMITYVVTHRKDERDDRVAQLLVYMMYALQNRGDQHHHYIQPQYSVENMEEEKGPVPTEKQFLRYVKEHGRQRAVNPSQNIRDQTFILEPPRIHESWTVKKNLDGDIEDATKTDEYVR